MNYENRSILIYQVDDLQEPATFSATPNQVFFLLMAYGKRVSGLPDHHLCFFEVHTMSGDMLDIPIVPAEIHITFSTD
jgi:hypothetical protein